MVAAINTKRPLVDLTDEDLARVVSNPTIARKWAHLANVSEGELRRGKPRAVRGVRAAIMRSHTEFAHVLAHAWRVVASLATEETGGDTDIDDVIGHAERASRILGARAAKAMLYALAAESAERFADAPLVRQHLEALVEAAQAAAESTDEEGWFTADAGEDVNDNTDEHDHVEDGDEPAEGNDQAPSATAAGSPTMAATDFDSLHQSVRNVHAAATELVARLRAAADSIEQGRPAEPLGDDADAWSVAVRTLLDAAHEWGFDPAETLPELLDQFTRHAAQRADADARRRDNARLAVKMAVLLRAEGRDDIIPLTMGTFGFNSLAEAEEALGERSAAPTDPVEAGTDAGDGGQAAEPGNNGFGPSDSGGGLGLQDPVDAETGPVAGTGDTVIAHEAPQKQSISETATSEPAAAIAPARESTPAALVEEAAAPAPVEVAPAPVDSAPAPVEAAPAPVEADSVKTQDAGDNPANESANTDGGIGERPWDDGDPPAIAQLLLAGREALAWYVAEAAHETASRRQLLRFAVAAAHCAPAAIDVNLFPSDAAIRAFDTNESLLLLSASLRAGLRLGYALRGFQSLLDIADTAVADPALRSVLHAAAAAVQRGHGRRHSVAGPSTEEWATRWAELGAEAERQLHKLRTKVLRFHRGTKVLRYLVRDGQPLAEALGAAVAASGQGVTGASSLGWAGVEEMAVQLVAQDRRERMLLGADTAVSSAQQLTRPIDGPVKVQLDELLSETGDLLSRIVKLRHAILGAQDLKDIAVSDELERAVAQVPGELLAQSVGDAAVANLIGWLRGDDPEPVASSVEHVLDAALIELFEIPRNEDGHPVRDPDLAELALLWGPRDPDLVVSGYLDRGNIARARAFLAARGLESPHYDDQILKAEKAATLRYERARAEAEEGTARLRALYNDDLARELGSRIARLEEVPAVEDRFDVAIDALVAISGEAEAALSAERDTLTKQVAGLKCDEASKSRVLERIAAQDEPLALYYLSLLEAGSSLPEAETSDGDDFSEFVPRVVDLAAAAHAEGRDVIAAVRQALRVGETPSDRILREGLASWKLLKTRRRSGDDFRRSLVAVLRMTGLTPRAQDWFRGDQSKSTAAGYATIRVAATPIDRSAVPQFGSQANNSYDITLVWDQVTPSRMMDFIAEGNRNRPNVILYFGVLSMAERRQLRALTRSTGGGKGFSPLVIDEAVIGWLSHLAEPGWGSCQRVTLPFTTLNPYVPTGPVPPEVFVGREEEQARITSPTGSQFVYGGRQLGKSALLKRIEHLNNDVRMAPGGLLTGRAAVYLDLNRAGIGEAQPPAALWPLLGEQLHAIGVLPGRTAPGTPRQVTAGIMAWLRGDDANQLLLLLDESDNFLTVDAGAGFPVLQAIKGLMDESGRRFKAVYAGLHQVQRFFDASNTPVAHGGEAIPIGPLRFYDAWKLVTAPLAALGYRFANPELVWRLLLVTNYQASLIQIVCDALVKHLQKRQIPERGGPMVITGDDVRAVCTDPHVADQIGQRFRWTIYLDSRYRVIALVVALNSIGADPGIRFSVDEIRGDCEEWWPEGFNPDQLSRNQFERYLVEMEGLGVLQRRDSDQWALRSPNVIQMLGTRDKLERELLEASTHFERPLEYNPTMARQVIADADPAAVARSPLTDYELTLLLNDGAGAHIVFGSVALGIDRVVEVVARQAQRGRIHHLVVDSLDSAEFTKAGAGGRRSHLIIDLHRTTPAGGGNLMALCRQVAARKNITATIVCGPRWLHQLPAAEDGISVHYLRRWSTAGLRAWYDSPFNTPVERAELYRATSGWPKLVEEVIGDVNAGCAPADGLTRLAARLAEPARAKQLLADSGVDPAVLRAWVAGIPFSHDGAHRVEQLPVTVADISEALGVDGARLVADLEALDAAVQDDDMWFLDRLLLAAAATIYSPPN